MLLVPAWGLEEDGELADALRRGDPDGVDRLVERYGDRVYSLARQLTDSDDAAAAAAEQALAVAVREIGTLDRAEPLGAWLRRLTARAACSRATDGGREAVATMDVLPPIDAAHGHFEPSPDWSRRLDELEVAGELGQHVSESIAALPATHRIILVLHDVEGWTADEIGDVLDLDAPAVRRRLHGARLFVRQLLSDAFGGRGTP